MNSVVFIVVVIGVLLAPQPAFAFGPFVHLELGLRVLGSVSVCEVGVAGLAGALIGRSSAFLFGCLGPDRVLAKTIVPYHWHSHNWSRAIRNLRAAKNGTEGALMLGFLCHLAADCVAHNLFVPHSMVLHYDVKGAGHLYWEFVLDAWCRRRNGNRELSGLLDLNDPQLLEILRKVIGFAPLGRRLGFRVTGRLMGMLDERKKGPLAQWLEYASMRHLEPLTAKSVLDLAHRAQLSVLAQMEDSLFTRQDPRGRKVIASALLTRRRLRRKMRSGMYSKVSLDSQAEKYARDIESRFVNGAFDGHGPDLAP